MKTEFGKASLCGFEMKYFKFGSGDRPLVIIPGLSVQTVLGSSKAVTDEFALMSEDFTVYVFDRREDLPASYTVRDMANDTVCAMVSLGLHGVYLYGASQGGMIALCIAAQHPELVKKLAVCSTSMKADSGRMNVIEEWTELARRGDAWKLYDSFCRRIYPDNIYVKYSKFLKTFAAAVTASELERFIILAEGTKDFDLSDDVEKIVCPVLAAGSEDDEVLGGSAIREIVDKFSGKPGFESIVYNGYGHATYDTAPDFREKLYSFFMKN